MTEQLISTYLQDHHAGSAAGVDAFRRIAKTHGDPAVRNAVSTLAREVAEDQKSLEGIMEQFGVKSNPLKNIPARIGEKAGRLKFNERLLKRSPLSDILELEALIGAVHVKSLGWRLLLEQNDPRLDKGQLEKLFDRARAQEDKLEELHVQQAHKVMQS